MIETRKSVVETVTMTAVESVIGKIVVVSERLAAGIVSDQAAQDPSQTVVVEELIVSRARTSETGTLRAGPPVTAKKGAEGPARMIVIAATTGRALAGTTGSRARGRTGGAAAGTWAAETCTEAKEVAKARKAAFASCMS